MTRRYPNYNTLYRRFENTRIGSCLHAILNRIDTKKVGYHSTDKSLMILVEGDALVRQYASEETLCFSEEIMAFSGIRSQREEVNKHCLLKYL